MLIPTYNRCLVLEKTLIAFSKLDINNIELEIIVVDNNSNDSTRDIIAHYGISFPIKYLFENKQGKNYALNSALKRATGDLIVFADDDITPQADWLQCIIESSHRWPRIRLFGGKVEPAFPKAVSKRIFSANFSAYVFGRYAPYTSEQISEGTTPVGANCWFRKTIFDEGIIYNTNIGPSGRGRISGSEMELFHRLVASGEKIVYVPSAVVSHRIQDYQLGLPYLLKRAYASGRGWVRIKAPETTAVCWFGAPRHMYRSIIENCFAIFATLLTGRNFLEPLMKVAEYLGCMKEYRELGAGRRQ